MNEKILEALTALANKLGTTAEYLWVVLVGQGKIKFVFWAVILVLAVVFTVAFFKKLSSMESQVGKLKDPDDRYSKFYWDDLPVGDWVWLVLSGVLGLVFIFWAMGDGYGAINGLLNPEYFALKTILSAL